MSDQIVDDAIRFLRAHSVGELRFDEHVRPLRYVIGSDGRLAAPVMVGMLTAADTVLFIPANEDGATEVQTTLEEFSEQGQSAALADRWRIYHGQPQDTHWAILHIDAARFKNQVIDGEALQRPNPLAGDEPSICRRWNQRADDLRRICEQFGPMAIEKPVMVGIDPAGLDVRARFEVVRVPAIEAMPSAADADRVMQTMLTRASGR